MQPLAIQIIKEEHQAISAVLFSLRLLMRRIREEGVAPDFRLFYAIMDYIVEYPDRWHHPKEDEYLFKRLRRRNPQAAALIDELEAEHMESVRLIDALKQALRHYEQTGDAELPAFAEAVEAYADFHWEHMRKEEERLIPLAERSLTPADWDAIAEAFRANDNPLFGLKPREHADELFRRILNLAPPPIGIGENGADKRR